MTLTPVQAFYAWLGLFLLVWFNVGAGGSGRLAALRFTVPLLNYLVFILAQLIPLRLLVIASHWSGRRRAGAMMLVIPLLLTAIPSACSASACVVLGGGVLSRDPSFSRVREVPVSSGNVVVYRTNGGALADWGIVVRQECTVIPRVLVIERDMLSQYPAFDADIAVIGVQSVVIATQAEMPKRIEAKVRRWPCLVDPG